MAREKNVEEPVSFEEEKSAQKDDSDSIILADDAGSKDDSEQDAGGKEAEKIGNTENKETTVEA